VETHSYTNEETKKIILKEAFAQRRWKKEMEKLDMPFVGESLVILSDSGCKIWDCKLAIGQVVQTMCKKSVE